MKVVLFVTAFCTVIATLTGIAGGFAPQQPAQISVDVELVNVVFTVFDKKGKF
jgi:hypothetical protein